jgi:uncharacterized protein (DUF1684 family)
MATVSTTHMFVVCVDDKDVEDISCGMVYRMLPDEKAAGENFVRIIDDSGEDYLYPRHRFVPIDVPEQDADRLSVACDHR